MKKLIASSLVAATMLATAVSADMKIGVGTDIIGGQQVLRVDIDGLAAGLRVEPRFMYASTQNSAAGSLASTQLTMGIAAYYDVIGPVAVGLLFDTSTASLDGKADNASLFAGGAGAGTTTIGLVLKAETDLTKNLSLAYELGYASTTNTSYSVAGTADAATQGTLAPYSAVTMRLWF